MTTADTNVMARAGTAGRAPLGLGSFGVWVTSQAASPELAVAVERLGYGAIWLGSADGDLRLAEKLLEATSTLTVATGIVNIWTYPPGPVGAAWHRVEQAHPGRLLLGIGVGHREVTGASYARPYQALTGYLDTLDMVGVPASRRVLAALGPQVLRLSAQRSAGAHPYLVTSQYIRRARGILGDRPLLAPEQKVVLDPDPARGRALARQQVLLHLNLANYVANLRRLGYTDTDLAAPGSDRLIDDLILHGTADEVTAKLREHLQAGADHVPVQLLTGNDADPLPGLTVLAERLLS
jgi:probable F420-dependent oxidoreductase